MEGSSMSTKNGGKTPTVKSETVSSSRATDREREFNELFFVHQFELYCWLKQQCGCQAIALDLTSETFLRAWNKFEIEAIDNPKGWLFRIAFNAMVSSKRAKKNKPHASLKSGIIPDPKLITPLDQMERIEEMNYVNGLISALPQAQQYILIETTLNGRGHREVGAELGISESACTSEKSRALKELRRKAADQIHE
jgi:RNA polymerase sigma factor (sigma-70 family)